MSAWSLEIAQLKRSKLFAGFFVTFVALAVYALWSGAAERSRWTQAVAANRAQAEERIAREQENVRLDRQEGFSPPGAPSAQTMDASLPPARGIVLTAGDAPSRPATAWITMSTRADTLFKNIETESPLSGSLGTLDLTWLAIVLLPLLIIAFGHDLLAAERDAARLDLLRVQSGSLRPLVWRRLALLVAVPQSVLLPGALAAILLGTRLMLAATWWLLASLYLLLWSLIAALVGARARTAGGAAATLLLLWLCVVIVLPAALALAVERLGAAPSRITQVIAMREAQLGLQTRMAALLDRYLTDHPELAGASASGFARSSFVAQRETEAQLAPVLAAHESARRRQAVWTRRLDWLSPAMLSHAALTHLAGTDSARHDAFVQQATAFAADWRSHLHEHLFLDRKLTVQELAALPRFRFEEPATGARTAAALAYLLILVAAASILLHRTLARPELR